MEPVFSLPYSEFCVAQQIANRLPASQGYSIYVPISRQQPGVDLILARRRCRPRSRGAIQVKSSRTYSRPSGHRGYRFYTWYNTFDCPPQADFVAPWRCIRRLIRSSAASLVRGGHRRSCCSRSAR